VILFALFNCVELSQKYVERLTYGVSKSAAYFPHGELDIHFDIRQQEINSTILVNPALATFNMPDSSNTISPYI